MSIDPNTADERNRHRREAELILSSRGGWRGTFEILVMTLVADLESDGLELMPPILFDLEDGTTVLGTIVSINRSANILTLADGTEVEAVNVTDVYL